MLWQVLCVVAAAGAALAQVPARPQLDLGEWWGPTDSKNAADTSINKFNVTLSDELIEDLRYRLTNYRRPASALQGSKFNYGFNDKQLEPWVTYWSEEYNFKEREAFLNQFPQYKTNIQGLDIHFLWVKPEVPAKTTVSTIVLLHGWPGSVREFYECIPALTTPRDGRVFEVIVPSLPGYGFSDAAVRPGMGPAQIAVIIKNLMTRLGHKKFYVQGGDWGSIIGSAMATLFQDSVLGLHSNMLFTLNSNDEIKSIVGGLMAALLPLDAPVDPVATAIVEETGYLHLAATKPDTMGVYLSDSPVGLCALVLEKFSTWTRIENRNLEDGGLDLTFTKDQLIDNLMIYWASNCISSSLRLYAEMLSFKHRGLHIDSYPTSVPIWKMEAVNEKIFVQPTNVMKFPNLLGVTHLEEGGHFVAFEVPELFAADVFKAVKAFEEFHKKNKKTH